MLCVFSLSKPRVHDVGRRCESHKNFRAVPVFSELARVTIFLERIVFSFCSFPPCPLWFPLSRRRCRIYIDGEENAAANVPCHMLNPGAGMVKGTVESQHPYSNDLDK